MEIFNRPEIWLHISTWAFGAMCGLIFAWAMEIENQKYLKKNKQNKKNND